MSQPFDMSLIQCGARLRRSPYFEATQRYGPKGYTVYNHMFFPIRYDTLEAEYWHLLNHVTVWDVSVERQVEITGPDAFAFTNLLTPRDLTKCAVGQGKYVVITAEDGGIVNDPVLLRLGENHFWLALADSDVLLYAKGVAVNSGLNVNLTEPDVSPIQIQGPKAKEVVQALFGDQVLDLKYYFFLETNLDGIPVIVTRTGWTAEVGYEVYLRDGSKGVALWERVMEAGKPHNIKPTGPSDIRRIEGGIYNWGADMTLENNPYEIGLGWLVDEDKKEKYLGKEALARVRKEGVKRKLVGVEIAGEPVSFNMTKWPVSKDGQRIGHITSATYSPRLQKNIGYAMVPAEHSALGGTLSVEVPDTGTRQATIVPKPFIDPKKEIPKS
ncbi:MAG TPA: glycine cleavage T C-terminal barrel domain-containing protein [Dehalococcoidia bacterium]|nr:glycine cleavage T C-terminal barrel domain-containing protein [Dehalococcoidia bacterium]